MKRKLIQIPKEYCRMNDMKDGKTKVKLGELCTIGRGSSPRPITDTKYHINGKIPWIKIADATVSDKYLYKTKEYVNELGASHSRLLPINSIIMATSGTLGFTIKLGVSGCIHDGWLYFENFSPLLEPDYFYYLLKNSTKYFENRAYGAAIQNVNTAILKNMEIDIPSISIQKHVAKTLSNYDDLLDINVKKITILKKQLRSIYDNYFPEDILKNLPEGWRIKKLQDICSFIGRGISPHYVEENGTTVLNQKCIRNHEISLEDARLQDKSIPLDKQLKFGDILINSTGVGTLGRIAQVYKSYEDTTVDSHITIVRPGNDVNIDYFGSTLLNLETHFTSMGKGATGQTELSREAILNTPVLIPSMEKQLKFSSNVRPMKILITVLSDLNKNLKSTRDILIPKLLTSKEDSE